MAIVFFYTSLILLVAMLSVKYFGVSLFRHRIICNIVNNNEKHCQKIVGKSRHYFSKIKFRNFHRLAVIISNFIKEKTILLKKKLDSQQPKFFLKPQNGGSKNSVSFFLKNVSEYKNSLRSK